LYLLIFALVEEACKLFLIWRITPQPNWLMWSGAITALTFGFSEAFFSNPETLLFNLFWLPISHLFFIMFGFFILRFTSIKENLVWWQWVTWLVSSTLLHWLFNLLMFKLNLSF